jgi:hypothetical protein
MHSSMRSLAYGLVWILLGAVAVACIGGERLAGPTINVRNETERPVLVQRDGSSWTVPAGETQFVERLPMTAIQGTAIVVLRDATTCSELGTVLLNFKENPDPLVVVANGVSPAIRPWTQADRESVGPPARSSPNSCPSASPS